MWTSVLSLSARIAFSLERLVSRVYAVGEVSLLFTSFVKPSQHQSGTKTEPYRLKSQVSTGVVLHLGRIRVD